MHGHQWNIQRTSGLLFALPLPFAARVLALASSAPVSRHGAQRDELALKVNFRGVEDALVSGDGQLVFREAFEYLADKLVV